MTSLEPEVIFDLLGFPITNTILATLLTDIVLIGVAVFVKKHISLIPGKVQNILEQTIDYFYSLTEQVAGTKVGTIYPWVVAFFLFIFFANLIGLMPGFGTIGFFEHGKEGTKFIPVLRAATSDFNTTLGLATVSLVATHVLSIKYNGIFDYLKRFFSLNPIFLFVGLLELVSEFTKLFSLSFRLFGNIFAGEVVLGTVSSMFAFIAPLPFIMLELIVALVQALVFSMLTMVFMSILTTTHAEEH